MRSLVLIFVSFSFLLGSAGSVMMKAGMKVVSRESMHTMDTAAIQALKVLEHRYGGKGLAKLREIENIYGKKGVQMISKYGDEAVVTNREVFSLVSRHGDKGYYLFMKYPASGKLYATLGESYIRAVDRYGAERVTRWLAEAQKHGKAKEVLSYLERFGTKAVAFYERNWGKLLVSGFVLLNADPLVAGGVEIGKSIPHEMADAAQKGAVGLLEVLLESSMVYFLGGALLLYVLFSLWLKWREVNRSAEVYEIISHKETKHGR
jgi:hypothetical protein